MSKKKIIIFVGSLTSGGAERVTVSLSRYLSKIENYSVVVVTLNEKSFDFYSLDSEVKRIAMNMSGATSGLSKYIINIKRMMAFRAIVKNEKPDIVLGMITRQAVLSILACLGLPVRVVVSERNFPPKRKNHSIWELLRTFLYRFADSHVVQTRKIAEWIAKNTKAKIISIIPNSVHWPLPTYEPKVAPSDFIHENEKMILAVGSLKYQKGFDLLIYSVSAILHSYPDWKVIILGNEVDDDNGNSGSNIRDKLTEIIENHNLAGRVLLPGRVGNVGDWYNRAEIFVLSSRYEGFPNVLLEAMASGLACISFDCDTGPKDMIEHDNNGILVSKNNTDALQKSIQRLIENPELRHKLAEQAVSVREKFSEPKIFEKWSEAFESILPSNL